MASICHLETLAARSTAELSRASRNLFSALLFCLSAPYGRKQSSVDLVLMRHSNGCRGKLVYVDSDHGYDNQCSPECRYACQAFNVSKSKIEQVAVVVSFRQPSLSIHSVLLTTPSVLKTSSGCLTFTVFEEELSAGLQSTTQPGQIPAVHHAG